VTRRYSPVCHTFWSDVRGWGDDATLMALYLLTCPHRTTEGLFRLPLGYVVEDLGWRIPRVKKALTALLDKGFVESDESVSVILIVNALRDQPPENPNQMKGAISRLEELPETPLLGRLYQLAREFRPLLAESLSEAFSNRLETLSNSLTPSPSLSLPPTPSQDLPRSRRRGRARPRQSDQDPRLLSLFEGDVPDGADNDKEQHEQEHIARRGPDPGSERLAKVSASGRLAPKEIVNLYHELCPSLPGVRSITPKREKGLAELAGKYSAGEIADLFAGVEGSDFLAGRSGTWRANLDWLMKSDNALRVIEGNFENRYGETKSAGVLAALDLVKRCEELEALGEQRPGPELWPQIG
jgi:hypothetical protein